jgi:hypothetical protein
MMMRCVVLAALLGGLPASAYADAPVCIATYRINHTDVPDDKAIVITMNDKSVYRAKVRGECVGLSTDTRGYTWEPNPGTSEICANLFTIRLNTSHSICLMGDIEMIKPPKR